MNNPSVSVVIPTRNRPELVIRAVRSALAQTVAPLEVTVVVDGVDEATVSALAAMDDPRVHTVALRESVGGADARNVGIQKSSGDWIALLDDDDEWHAEKLALQLEAAAGAKKNLPIVTCRLIARRPDGEEIWPYRMMREGEPMSEYLLCREASFRQGEGFIQTSTLLVPRKLILEIPFSSGLKRHQDWDWLIRAAEHPQVEIVWVWKPLVIYHVVPTRKSVSAGNSLAPSFEWINGNRLITPKARAYFYATQIAVRCGSFKNFMALVYRTIRYPRAFIIAMGLALTPRTLVSQLRAKGEVEHA